LKKTKANETIKYFGHYYVNFGLGDEVVMGPGSLVCHWHSLWVCWPDRFIIIIFI